MASDHDHWRRVAAEWVTWARTPNHDAFWAYRASLLAFIGRGEGEALDVGCGEGRVSRVLKDCGYRVTATDPVEAFISAAKQAGTADDYKVAAAADLPFADDSFDLAIAYNVLMDVDDVPIALREIGRVLRPTGTLLISIVHPFSDRGASPGQSVVRRSSTTILISVASASRELRSGMDCKCTSRVGHSPWKIIRPRWKARDSRLQRFGSRYPMTVRQGLIWSGGGGFPYFSG
jgi:SAM-dependent methyltransferase